MENHTTSGLRPFETNPTWYCGRVAPGRERAFQRGLRVLNVPAYVPVHNQSITRRQYNWKTQSDDLKTYPREMPLFPGYVFVVLADGVWALIRERIAYKPNWLTCDGRPAQIPAEVVETLQAEERNGFVQIGQSVDYHEGDEVEISEPGIWYGRKGILASDPDRRVLTLHLIAESYALQPALITTRVKIDREYVRSAIT